MGVSPNLVGVQMGLTELKVRKALHPLQRQQTRPAFGVQAKGANGASRDLPPE